jgi:hypothetical protein
VEARPGFFSLPPGRTSEPRAFRGACDNENLLLVRWSLRGPEGPETGTVRSIVFDQVISDGAPYWFVTIRSFEPDRDQPILRELFGQKWGNGTRRFVSMAGTQTSPLRMME